MLNDSVKVALGYVQIKDKLVSMQCTNEYHQMLQVLTE